HITSTEHSLHLEVMSPEMEGYFHFIASDKSNAIVRIYRTSGLGRFNLLRIHDALETEHHILTGEDVMFSFKCIMNPKQIETTQTRSSVNSHDSIRFVAGDKMKVAFHFRTHYFQMERVFGARYV